jgi:L-rhamnose mutarotase
MSDSGDGAASTPDGYEPGRTRGAVPERVCFQLQVRPDLIDEYRARHRAVPAEMLREIEASGRRNYSIFLRDDGMLIGYFETDDLAASDAYLAASTVAARWERESARFFEDLDERPDQGYARLQQVFQLEVQLSAPAREV